DQTLSLGPEDVLISTMPIQLFAEHLGIQNHLAYRGAKLVFVAVTKPVVLPGRAHFLYYDHPDIIFHRVSEQKKFGVEGFPEDKTVLSVEIAFTDGDRLDQSEPSVIIDRVVQDLVKVGLIDQADVEGATLKSLPY